MAGTSRQRRGHLPNLSDKERAHALELAMKARKRRAVLKARMKSGELAFTDALNEEDAKRIEVVSLLKCVPGIGASKAEAIRRLVKIPLGRRVSGLGIRQREELTAFMKFLNTYGVKVFDPAEAKRVLEKEVSAFAEIMESLAALRREADRNNVHLQTEDFDNLDNE